MDINALLNTAGIVTATQAITGNPEASATAAGYAAWIASVTGRPPQVTRIGQENRVLLVMDEAQQLALRQWLSGQVGTLVSKGEPPIVDAGLGPAIGPWALQYAAPLILGALVVGWVGHWFTTSK